MNEEVKKTLVSQGNEKISENVRLRRANLPCLHGNADVVSLLSRQRLNDRA